MVSDRTETMTSADFVTAMKAQGYTIVPMSAEYFQQLFEAVIQGRRDAIRALKEPKP